MKKLIAAALIAVLTGGALLAQDATEPDVAYRLISDWVAKKEAKNDNNKTVAWVMAGIGAASLTGAAVTWFAGDAISTRATGMPMDYTDKVALTAALGGSGLVFSGVGAIIYFAKPTDYRAKYSDVFNESNPVVREALAAATLETMAKHAYTSRIVNGTLGLAVPLVVVTGQAVMNTARGEPWHKGVGISSSWTWGLVPNISQLFIKSDEEIMYDKYLAAREMLFSTPANAAD